MRRLLVWSSIALLIFHSKKCIFKKENPCFADYLENIRKRLRGKFGRHIQNTMTLTNGIAFLKRGLTLSQFLHFKLWLAWQPPLRYRKGNLLQITFQISSMLLSQCLISMRYFAMAEWQQCFKTSHWNLGKFTTPLLLVVLTKSASISFAYGRTPSSYCRRRGDESHFNFEASVRDSSRRLLHFKKRSVGVTPAVFDVAPNTFPCVSVQAGRRTVQPGWL